MATKRTFVAIDISEDVRRAISDHVSVLKAAFAEAPIKWERPEKFKVTMKFLGDADENQLEERIRDTVNRAASTASPFKLTVNGQGSFRRRESAVLWIGVKEKDGETGILTRIARTLEGGGQLRRFHPHITVARIRKPGQARELIGLHKNSGLNALEFPVDHLTIYQSKLLQTGSVYSIVSKHRFRSE